jgi:hypothetical protein
MNKLDKEVRTLIYDLQNSLQYVEDHYPQLVGYGVRQQLVEQAKKLLKEDFHKYQ